METILVPRPGRPRSPVAEGFAHMARLLDAALGAGPAVSPRTHLFRPLPDDPRAWLLRTFPTYFQNARGELVPLAPHHEAWWAWCWALRPGVAHAPFIAIWPRGGGKSTSIELGAAVVGYFGLRRYALYVCSTQKQADDHVSNVATLLEGLGVERAINRYGFSRGWSINRLRTAEGFTLDAIGLDGAARGIRIDFARTDLQLLDELDEPLDAPATIQRKIEVLTQSILPTGDEALSVAGVQNIPNKDGIFARLADGRAEFLMDRQVSGPHPALVGLPEQDWYTTEVDVTTGQRRFCLPCGEPIWAGQDRAACEKRLNEMGPRAFEIECLHRVQRLSGGVFQRDWFAVVDDWPRGASRVRYWDFAATEVDEQTRRRGKDPDWTVGLLMALWRGQFWVLQVLRARLSPEGIQRLVAQSAALDGRSVAIWLEEEGGSSGKYVTDDMRRETLLGYAVSTWHSTGSKGARAVPLAKAAEAGNVFLLRAAWNEAFLEEYEKFGLPGVHDDQVDAGSGAHYALTLGQTLLPSDFSLAKALDQMTQPGLQARAQQAAHLPTALATLWGVQAWEDEGVAAGGLG